MFNEQTKAGIVNNLGIVAGVKATPANLELINAVVDKVAEVGVAEVTTADIVNVTIEVDGKERSLTDVQASKVAAAIDFHKAVLVSAKKVRVKKPTIAETFVAETSEQERDDVAYQVAELRIPAEGQKPAWKDVRNQLGLKLDEFHKVIRHSSGWLEACVDRIQELEEEGWEYPGKLDVLTGIDDFEIHRRILEEQREEEANEADSNNAAALSGLGIK